MGRGATGVIGMKFRKGDNLLAMAAISSDNKNYVFTATDGGYAKRTKLEEYRTQGRGGIGVKAAKIDEEMEPYFDLAKEYGYRVYSLVVENRHGGKNIHNVPKEKIEEMEGRFSVKII